MLVFLNSTKHNSLDSKLIRLVLLVLIVDLILTDVKYKQSLG